MEGPAPVRLAWGAVAFAVLALEISRTAAGIWPQDGMVFWTAARMALSGNVDVYGLFSTGVPVTTEHFAAVMCEPAPDPQGCLDGVLPYLSPPGLLPVIWPLGALPASWGYGALRLLIWALLVVPMGLQLERWMEVRPQDGPWAVVTALATFPPLFFHVETGQNVAFLVAATVLVDREGQSRGRDVGAGLMLAVGALAKGSPALVMAAWAAERRSWSLGAFVAGVAGPSLVSVGVYGPGLWADWWAMLGDYNRHLALGFPNVSVNAAVAWGADGLGWSGGAVSGLSLGLRLSWVVAALGVVWWRGSRPTPWIWLGWAAWLVLTPLVWAHYLWVALAFVVGPLAREGHPRWVARAALAHGLALSWIVSGRPESVLASTALLVAYGVGILWWLGRMPR